LEENSASMSEIVLSVSFWTSASWRLRSSSLIRPLLLVGLQAFHPVAAHVAGGDRGALGILAGELGEFLAPLLGQLRIGSRSVVPVDDRVEPEPGGADRLVDGADIGLVPHLTEIIRGSGHRTVASWFSGMRAP
jgi:hypothetical protein